MPSPRDVGVVIVAAGRGVRLGGSLPKQYLPIAGVPMLLRAITYRRDTLDVVVEMALAGGQGGAVRVDNRIKLGPG